MQSEHVQPYFHYNCDGQVMTLDSQYSPSGDRLALSFSNGTIALYSSPRYSSPEQTQKNPQLRYTNANHIFLKIAWSFNQTDTFAGGSISKQIFIFRVINNMIECTQSIKTQYIPIFLCYYPCLTESYLTVGCASGYIELYNKNLTKIISKSAHKQTINWLSWQPYLNQSQRNKWTSDYYPQLIQNNKNSSPMLISCSSDKFIKIWKIDSKKFELKQLYKFEAHNKQIRQVMWKPNYYQGEKSIFASCSEDGDVKFWVVSQEKSRVVVHKSCVRSFNGPVYRAQYNNLGTIIAIRYLNHDQQKIQTKIFKQFGTVLQEQISMTSQQKQPL